MATLKPSEAKFFRPSGYFRLKMHIKAITPFSLNLTLPVKIGSIELQF